MDLNPPAGTTVLKCRICNSDACSFFRDEAAVTKALHDGVRCKVCGETRNRGQIFVWRQTEPTV